MAVICIGPVCIPWTCIPAIVYFLWRILKPMLPEKVAARIEEETGKLREQASPYLEKIPGCKKRKKKDDDKTGKKNEPGAAFVKDSSSPGVLEVVSKEHFDTLLKQSKEQDFMVLADFTAPWCKPCQKIKPFYKELSEKHPGICFLEVDADEQEDIAARCEVLGLPTFQVYKAGTKVDSAQGENGLGKIAKAHLGG